MTSRVEILTVFSVNGGVPDQVAEHAEFVMQQLLELEEADNIVDSAVSVDTAKREVTVEVVGCGPDGIQALVNGLSAMRAAIHAAGGATPQWPHDFGGWEIIRQESKSPDRVPH